MGIPGLIAYLAVLMSTLWMAGSSLKTFTRTGDSALRVVAVGSLAGMVASAVHGLVDLTAWGTRAAFFSWMVMGLVVALYGIARERDESARE